MEDETKNLLTETAKIRFYIMNLIFRNGNQSVKIMSTRALAEQFDVARGTVRAAVEKMVEEKYLITRRGIGTFTNPSKAFCRLQKVPPKLIGIKMQGGDQFFLDPPAMRTLAAGADLLRQRPAGTGGAGAAGGVFTQKLHRPVSQRFGGARGRFRL